MASKPVDSKPALCSTGERLCQIGEPITAARRVLPVITSGEHAGRPGGYTRILRMMPRPGDNADMALMQLVDRPAPAGVEAPEADAAAGGAKKKSRAKKKAAGSGDEAAAAPKRARKKKAVAA